MYKITEHPILDIPKTEQVSFEFNGQTVIGRKGYTIAAALHQAGYPVHSHSVDGRERSLECGIGKCGACKMLVDGEIRRICITPVDGVKSVKEIPHDYFPQAVEPKDNTHKVYKTQVVIIGAGPAGLACRETLNRFGVFLPHIFHSIITSQTHERRPTLSWRNARQRDSETHHPIR